MKAEINIKNITLNDQINAIEEIVSSFFTVTEDGNINYTPYYADIAQTTAIIKYFLSGVKNKNNLSRLMYTNPRVKTLVEKFSRSGNPETDKENEQYITIMEFVNRHASDKIDFIRQKLIHSQVTPVDDFVITLTDKLKELDLSSFGSPTIAPENSDEAK